MTEQVRLAEVLAVLSLACDAADGFAHETTVRSAVLAGALAERLDDDRLVSDVVFGALLRHIGCTGFAVEEAHRYGAGDDVALREVLAEVDFGQPDAAAALINDRLAMAASPADRATALHALLGDGPAAGRRHNAAQCDAAERLGALLPVSLNARSVTSDAFERWDGLGGPAGKAGDEISLVSRVVEVTYVAELFRSRQGRGGAVAELRARAGGQLDPTLVDCFLDSPGELFDLVDDPDTALWERLLAAERLPPVQITPSQLDDTALAFARFSDLKSTWLTGHSEAVSGRAAATAAALGLSDEVQQRIRQAGLLHDIGRVGVPTGIWDVPRALSQHERDRVRFHAWETARILGATPLFGEVADIAGATHEQVDGSGYHRGIQGAAIGQGARILGAADVWCGLRSDRPHRPAFDERGAREVMGEMVAQGELDRVVVSALFETVSAVPLPAMVWPSGLTDREIDVLRLVATGASNKDVARDLGITAKTVAHHVEHVYDKIGVRSRAGATLFVLEHGLATSR